MRAEEKRLKIPCFIQRRTFPLRKIILQHHWQAEGITSATDRAACSACLEANGQSQTQQATVILLPDSAPQSFPISSPQMLGWSRNPKSIDQWDCRSGKRTRLLKAFCRGVLSCISCTSNAISFGLFDTSSMERKQRQHGLSIMRALLMHGIS